MIHAMRCKRWDAQELSIALNVDWSYGLRARFEFLYWTVFLSPRRKS